jgi:hypothetical protein
MQRLEHIVCNVKFGFPSSFAILSPCNTFLAATFESPSLPPNADNFLLHDKYLETEGSI